MSCNTSGCRSDSLKALVLTAVLLGAAGALDQASVEEACEGKFIELRKSFFLLTGSEAPLLAKVGSYNRAEQLRPQTTACSPPGPSVHCVFQAQALLRWHQSSGFCSATGQPTHRNQAGSQRICSSSGIIYYPKVTLVQTSSRRAHDLLRSGLSTFT